MQSPNPSAGLPQEVTVIPHKLCYQPYRVNTLAAKSEEWNGKPRLECAHGRHPPPQNSCRCTALDMPERKELTDDRVDRLAGKATTTSSLRLGRSEVERSFRHYLRAQSQGHHAIDRLEERGVEIGSARRSSLKG